MIKKIIYIILLVSVSLFTFCTNNEDTDKKNVNESQEPKGFVKQSGANSKCVFDKEVYNLGSMVQGEIVKYTITFKNTGEDLLIITSATASCGCTVPKWTKEPIPKGGEGQLEITFDSSGRYGKQSKSVKLITNSTERVVEVNFVAEVTAPKQ